MHDINKKQDLRVTKSQMALKNAMLTLLQKKSFDKISVNDICEEAVTSRATFYAHFEDKYSLLTYALLCLKTDLEQLTETETEEETIASIVRYVYENPRLFKNLIAVGNGEELKRTLDELFVNDLRNELGLISQNSAIAPHIPDILLQYCVGGMVQIVIWLIKENFPVPQEVVVDLIVHTLNILLQDIQK